jgi:hypothetical protein
MISILKPQNTVLSYDEVFSIEDVGVTSRVKLRGFKI